MIVNIYYGGRGLIDDPAIYVVRKLKETLEEIRVQVNLYNLYEQKGSISTLPKTLKEADGVILATTVEWLGIGGYMEQFLDACWLYGDKEMISKQYMMPVVLSTTYGEREAQGYLVKAWDLLGGLLFQGLSAYVEDQVDFEANPAYANIIEKKAELFYREINQKSSNLPGSNFRLMKKFLKRTNELTPQEKEQLSIYVSDNHYIKKQKEDIEELTQIFKGILDNQETSKEG